MTAGSDLTFRSEKIVGFFPISKQTPLKYPNELGYGDNLKDYPPALKLGAAKAVIDWVKEHRHEIRLTPKSDP